MNPLTRTAVLCAAFSSASAIGQQLTEHSSTNQDLHFAAAGPHTLEIRAITGKITVEASADPDVRLLVEKTITAATQDEMRTAEREVTLDTSADGARVRAIVRYPEQETCGEEHQSGSRSRWEHHYEVRFDFTVRVPADTRIELCTINRGDIAVQGTLGGFSIKSVNGRITMADVGGSGEAVTVNGPVTASFVAAPRATSVFRTINGSVVLTVPEPFSADLRMKTFNGGLYTDFEAQTLPAEGLVPAQKEDGMYVYRSKGFTRVRIDKGGPELTLETLNGDVRVLRRAAK
jgi:hypothetical protein